MKRELVILLISCIFLRCTSEVQKNDFLLAEKINVLENADRSLYDGPPNFKYSHEIDSTHPYHFFKDNVTKKQLVELTYHDFPMVRIFAFLALEELKYDRIPEIIFGHLSDTAEIVTSSGCVIYTRTIADFMMYKAYYTLKGNIKDSLRDIIFYNHSNLSNFSSILWDCNGYEPYYSQILQINKDSSYRTSLMALATFKKEKDLDFLETEIRSLDYEGGKFQVIEKFPHDQFKPLLYDYHLECKMDTTIYISDLFYYAVASYKSKWANGILNDLLVSGSKDYYKRRDKLQAIMKATDKHDTILFSSLRDKALTNLGKDTFLIDYLDYGMFNSWW